MALQGFGQGIETDDEALQYKDRITLTTHDELEPSPVSDPEDVRFYWLAETIREVFGPDVIVAPVLLTGILDVSILLQENPLMI